MQQCPCYKTWAFTLSSQFKHQNLSDPALNSAVYTILKKYTKYRHNTQTMFTLYDTEPRNCTGRDAETACIKGTMKTAYNFASLERLSSLYTSVQFQSARNSHCLLKKWILNAVRRGKGIVTQLREVPKMGKNDSAPS